MADRAANEIALRANLLSLAATRTRHVGSDPNVERYDPDLWTDEFYFLNQPGQAEIQSDLFYDYRTNVDAYPKWQAWMREKQPRLLVIWGKYEMSFDLSEPEAYRRDVPKAEVHMMDAGILRWTRQPMRSPHWSEPLSLLQVGICRLGAPAEVAIVSPVEVPTRADGLARSSQVFILLASPTGFEPVLPP